jgi:uncharacterized protein DUF1572
LYDNSAMSASDLNDIILDALRTRIVGVIPDQIHAAVAPLTEEQLWWRPNDASNSAGIIVLHLTGSVRHFVTHLIGGQPFERNRPAEFEPPQTPSKAEVLQQFDAMIAGVKETLATVRPEDLAGASSEPHRYRSRFDDLYAVSLHMSSHAGQLAYIAKSVQPGSVTDLWGRAHRAAGAWRDPA